MASSDVFRNIGGQTFENLGTYKEEPLVGKLCRRVGGFVSAFGKDVSNFIRMIRKEIKNIRSSGRENNMFNWILFTIFFVLFEISYAYFNENLSMIAHAFHTSYSITKLFVVLLSITLPKHHSPTNSYSYGVTALGGLFWFTNAIFHIFVCVFIWYEALERFLDYEHEEDSDASMAIVVVICCAGFLLNFVLTAMMTSIRNKNTELHKDSWTGINLAIANAVITLSVIISNALANSVRGADSIIALSISVFILYEAVPAFMNSAKVLLQTTPATLQDRIERNLEEVRGLEGVLEYHSAHFWTQATGEYVGSLVVRVKDSAETQTVLLAVHQLFEYITHLTIQVDSDSERSSYSDLYNDSGYAGHKSHGGAGGHGHSHGGGSSEEEGHGHSHGGGGSHGHSHGGGHKHEEDHDDHHEHEEDHGHSHSHGGHGHSHGGGSPEEEGHGHSHGGAHGHSHGGHSHYEDDDHEH